MKRAAVIAGLFAALFLASVVTVQAGTHYSFGFSFGIGPAAAYGYYANAPYPYAVYPPYYYPGYYPYPYYPAYGAYAAPRYYGGVVVRSYAPRYYYRNQGNGVGRGPGKSNPRSSSGRWR